MKKFISFICLILVILATTAITNIIVTVSVPEVKYTNMYTIATNQNFLSVEAYFSDKIIKEIENQRISILIELWQNATLTQQENALNALRNP